MKIAVTGAAGFIGGWLVTELREAGHDVVTVDQHWMSAPISHIAHLDKPGAAYAAFRVLAPDLVVHLAAQVGREFGEDDASRTVAWNALATTLVARACGELGIRLAYASTSEIYGDHGDELCAEDTAWRLPHNLYGLTKRWGEEAARLYAPDGLVIFRPSMPYGPGAPPGRGRRAMDTMLWQAHHRMPITVHKGAERSWCWVGDTVRGIRLAIEASVADPPAVLLTPTESLTEEDLAALKARFLASGQRQMVLAAPATYTSQRWDTYNIGRDDDPRSMLDIAQMACKLAGAPEDLIVEVDAPPGQTVVKRLATDRLRALGWAPTVDLADGMQRVYDWVSRYDAEGNLR